MLIMNAVLVCCMALIFFLGIFLRRRWAGYVAQLVHYLVDKHKATGSIPSTYKPGMVTPVCTLNAWEVEVGSSGVQDHPTLHTKVQGQSGLHEILPQIENINNSVFQESLEPLAGIPVAS